MLSVDNIVVEPPGDGEIVEPMAWFESPGPLEIEIGCGKGGFLLSRARDNPHARLLGIEWANKYFRHAADRMARWNVTNVRVMHTDARFFVLHHLPPGCVSVLHVYHPDPWPKKRHHKRRLIQPEFAAAAARVLTDRGYCLIQSDHEEYFRIIQERFDRQPRLEAVAWDSTGVHPGANWGGTNFEIKYAREGRPIHRVAYTVRRAMACVQAPTPVAPVRCYGDSPVAFDMRAVPNRSDSRAE